MAHSSSVQSMCHEPLRELCGQIAVFRPITCHKIRNVYPSPSQLPVNWHLGNWQPHPPMTCEPFKCSNPSAGCAVGPSACPAEFSSVIPSESVLKLSNTTTSA